MSEELPLWATVEGRYLAEMEVSFLGAPTGKWTLGKDASKAFIPIARGLSHRTAIELGRRLNEWSKSNE